MEKGGCSKSSLIERIKNIRERFLGNLPEPQVYPLDDEDELIITQTITDIVKKDNPNVLAYNICRDHLHLLLVCEEEEADKIVGKIKSMSARACNINKG
jgi:REP element-mobilizing transposase RayT